MFAALCSKNMKYSACDYNVLSYLLDRNEISYKELIAWSYDQYTDEGIDPFIEKISLTSDLQEVIELIANEYEVYSEPEAKFLLGEAADKYFCNKINLQQAINKYLFDIDDGLLKTEKSDLYLAEDYYGWHDTPDIEAEKIALPIFKKYRPFYASKASKFKA